MPNSVATSGKEQGKEDRQGSQAAAESSKVVSIVFISFEKLYFYS